MKFYCPMCKCIVHEQASLHFRFTHHIPQESMVDILFEGLAVLDERITNLCELLEIREKP